METMVMPERVRGCFPHALLEIAGDVSVVLRSSTDQESLDVECDRLQAIAFAEGKTLSELRYAVRAAGWQDAHVRRRG